MWFTPLATASRRTAIAASISRGGPPYQLVAISPGELHRAVTHAVHRYRRARQSEVAGQISLFNHFVPPFHSFWNCSLFAVKRTKKIPPPALHSSSRAPRHYLHPAHNQVRLR